MKTKIFCDIADFKTIKIFNKKSIFLHFEKSFYLSVECNLDVTST